MRGRRALAGITFAAAAALATGAATAQVPYQFGSARGNVTVDMGVLESLGPTPTVPEMLRPGTPVGELGYDPRIGSLAATAPSRRGQPYPSRAGAPTLGVDTAPAPDWLRRPDAPRYAPLPDTLGRPAPARGSTPVLTPPPGSSRSTASLSPAPTLRAPEPAAPAPRAAEPSPPPPRAEPKPQVTAPPPPKPVAPAETAEAAPRTPPAPAPKAPETPKAPPPPAPPPPALPTVSAPAPSGGAPAPKPAGETQVAAATAGPTAAEPAPSSQGASGDVVRVPFDPNQSTLPTSASSGLDALIARLRKDDTLRVQLLAYADGDDDNANKARRLSLSRALAVRAYLIDKQIQSTRMDVRALGNRTKESPKDRVDVVLVSR